MLSPPCSAAVQLIDICRLQVAGFDVGRFAEPARKPVGPILGAYVGMAGADVGRRNGVRVNVESVDFGVSLGLVMGNGVGGSVRPPVGEFDSGDPVGPAVGTSDSGNAVGPAVGESDSGDPVGEFD